jgi:hypothetical protein
MDQPLMTSDDTERRSDARETSDNLIINIQIQETLDKMDRRDAHIKHLFFACLLINLAWSIFLIVLNIVR